MALRGFKVIELAGLAPAPFCGMILRDHGASVIRVDRPHTHPHADTLARGKRSLVLDLKKPGAARVLSKLCAHADVLIDPFRPGVMEKLQLGPSELCKLNPKLIYARLTGFGQFGPYSKMAGHDINYIAVSGVLSMLGGRERPSHPINLLGDFAGGGLLCALGICLALLERHASDKGQVIDSNMVEGSAYVSSWLWTTRSENHPVPLWKNERGRNLLDGGAHFYRTYQTKDGKFMAVGALEPAFYAALMEGLGLEEFGQGDFEDPRCAERISEVFRERTQAEWCAIFDGTDACVTPVVSLEEAAAHPHNATRGSFVEGVPGPAPHLSRTPALPGPDVDPLPGQHTREILVEEGFGQGEIEDLLRRGVVHALQASL